MKPYSTQKRVIEPPLTPDDIEGMRSHPPMFRREWFDAMLEQIKPTAEIFANQRTLDDGCAQSCSAIYFLFAGKELVYVGRAVCLGQRLDQHRYPNLPSLQEADWFDSVAWLPVDRDWLKYIESLYLHLFQPKYNRAIGQNRDLFSCLVQSRMKARKQ